MSALARIPFSILDLAPIVQGRDAADAFRNTVAVAQQAERLGYNRFWLAEHHNINGVASSATAVLIGHVAAHQDAARGLGRRDAAQSRAADHRRAVRHAGNPVSRPHRPGPGPRARQRRRHAARAAARRRSGLEFPRWLKSCAASWRPRVRDSRCARFRRRSGYSHLAARVERLQRPHGRRAGPAVLLRRSFLARGHGRDAPLPAPVRRPPRCPSPIR